MAIESPNGEMGCKAGQQCVIINNTAINTKTHPYSIFSQIFTFFMAIDHVT